MVGLSVHWLLMCGKRKETSRFVDRGHGLMQNDRFLVNLNLDNVQILGVLDQTWIN